MIYCGIDPGNTGAIAVFKKKKLIALIDMPIEAKLTGKGFQTSAPGLADIFKEYKIKKAYIEKVHSMPGQGVTSVFTFGRGLGVIEGVAAALEISSALITPQAWKKEFGLLKKEKDASRTLALQKYPAWSTELRLKKHIGRSDAIFIGLFGKIKL